MFGAVRLGDFVSSTCKKPSGPFVTASPTSFVNGKPRCRLGDKSVPGICISGICISGSKSVFIDGKPAAHILSKVICGKIVNCSKTVFVDL